MQCRHFNFLKCGTNVVVNSSRAWWRSQRAHVRVHLREEWNKDSYSSTTTLCTVEKLRNGQLKGRIAFSVLYRVQECMQTDDIIYHVILAIGLHIFLVALLHALQLLPLRLCGFIANENVYNLRSRYYPVK